MFKKKYLFPIAAIIFIMIITFLNTRTDDELYYMIYNFEGASESADTSLGVLTVTQDTGLKDGDIICEIPAIHIERGKAVIDIDHQGDVDSTVRVMDGENVIEEFVLPADELETRLSFESDKDIYNLKVDFLYPGNGTVTIKHVYLRKTPFFYSDSLAVGIMIAITVIVLCLWMRKKKFMDMSDRERFFYCIIGSVILLLNYPLLYGYMQYDGSDISYNVARIEAIKNELLSGQFLPQLYTDGLNGQGYIGSLYPSLFLYIPALLRICHVSISVSNQIFMIIINLFTMFTAWFCMKRLTGDRYVALTAMLLYCSMPYRISCMYYRYALGELLAIAFIPLVIAGLYEIVYGNKKKWPILTIGISGIIESHILSTLLIVIFCVLMVLACIARIIKDRRWIYLIMAALSAAVLNMGFIVPFLYYPELFMTV